jgi:hypothetical protein
MLKSPISAYAIDILEVDVNNIFEVIKTIVGNVQQRWDLYSSALKSVVIYNTSTGTLHKRS